MQKSLIWLGSLVMVGGAMWGCGSSDAGFQSGSGNGGTSGASGASAGGNAGDGSGGSAGLACDGTHPQEDGGERRCAEGACHCVDTDQCLSAEIASRCCDEGELECFREGGKFDCKGTHPQVEGDKRFCEEGACYCQSRDACLPAETAETCCPEPPKCT